MIPKEIDHSSRIEWIGFGILLSFHMETIGVPIADFFIPNSIYVESVGTIHSRRTVLTDFFARY